MRFLPRFMYQRFFRWRLIPSAVQPPMPFRRHPTGFGLTVENHPAFLVVLGFIKDIALLVFPDALAFAPRELLGVQRLTIPPRENAQNLTQDTHRCLRKIVASDMD